MPSEQRYAVLQSIETTSRRSLGVFAAASALGFTWGAVTAFSQAGIRYFSAAPNFFDRIGNFMATWQDKPFWWVGPSGKDKVLFWVPNNGLGK